MANDDMNHAWAKVQSMLSKFADALEEFRTIKVRTVVSDLEAVTVPVDAADPDGPRRVVDIQVTADPTAGGVTDNKIEGLVTKIDMLQGDISFARSPNLTQEQLAALERAHLEHVKLGQKIFTDNIRFVADTVERFVNRRSTPEE